MKEYRLEVKVKNNHLYKAMLENGIETASALSRASGVGAGVVGRCFNLKESLYNTKGKMRPCWLILSKTLKRLPEDLIPAAHHFEGLEKNTGSKEISLEEIGDVLIAGESAQDSTLLLEMQGDITEALGKLTPREERVLRMRFGLGGDEPLTLEECGKIIGVRRERVRQIEIFALRKLRHPERRGDLRAHLNGLGE